MSSSQKKYSRCPALRDLHNAVYDKGESIDEVISSLAEKKKHLVTDDSAGGTYIKTGYGNLGRNSTKKRDPCQPSLLENINKADHLCIAEITGPVVSAIARVANKYCPRALDSNRKLKENNTKCMWPPIEYQGETHNWMCTQNVIRTWGGASPFDSERFPLEHSIVAAHADTGDVDEIMPNIYSSGGGKDGRGGPVAGTDAAVFQHKFGGSGFLVTTCICDVVVVTLLHSASQLHGCVLNSVDFEEDKSAWTTRIISYMQNGVYHWMVKNPDVDPFTNIP